ncbi:MAG: hypothetical protein QOH06_4153 [Acidobacteriota bacterium]|nr:hypothetical protein [Acidobacteriota bacterium]
MRMLTLVLFGLTLMAAPGMAQAPAGFCGVEDLDQDTARWVESLVKSLPRPEMRLAGSVQIPVAFHVVYAGTKGRVSDQQIATLLNNLNAAYGDSPFSFHLASVSRTNNKTWYGNCLSLKNEKTMKRRLAVDPRHTLNIYTCKTSNFPVTGGVLGYAYLPFMFPENSYMHGAVLHPALMPGGHPQVGVYGMIVGHELGHYLGLYHTFQGGCGATGDFVADTPDEGRPTGTCTAGTDTCPAFPGLDDVTNFMNYGDDLCMDHFTPGQIQRMVEQTSALRPGIYN